MLKFNIRTANKNDIPAIAKVHRQTWLATYPNKDYDITVEDILTKDFMSAEKIKSWQERLADDSVRVWVAETQGQIVGICQARKKDEVNELSSIYILPEFQSMGIGKRLMAEVFAWLGSDKPIVLDVVSYNTQAIAFYEKLGFSDPKPIDHPSPFPNGKVLPSLMLTKKFR